MSRENLFQHSVKNCSSIRTVFCPIGTTKHLYAISNFELNIEPCVSYFSLTISNLKMKALFYFPRIILLYSLFLMDSFLL